MKKILLFFILLLPLQCFADIYLSTDTAGAIQYSDVPPSDNIHVKTTPVTLASTQTYHVVKTPVQKIVQFVKKPKITKSTYLYVTIKNPQQGETIRNNSGKIKIDVLLKPRLNKGDRINYWLDDKLVGNAKTTLHLKLNNIDRGTRTLMVEVIDKNKQILVASDTTTFYLQRARVLRLPKPK